MLPSPSISLSLIASLPIQYGNKNASGESENERVPGAGGGKAVAHINPQEV